MSEWIPAAATTEITEGCGKVVSIGDKQLAVFHCNGAFYAIDNTCPHRGGPLGEGDIEGTVVTCPWHGWQFDVVSGESPVNPAVQVKKYPIKLDGGVILLELNLT